MNTFTKELKIMIAMISACISCAFVALVALFVRAGGMDIIGTGVLVAVLVAFVAVGSSVIVDEYHAEQRRQIASAHWYELDAVRYMRDEYADTLSMTQADLRDELDYRKKLSRQVSDLQEKNAELVTDLADSEWRETNASRDLVSARDTIKKLNIHSNEQRLRIEELLEELNEIRYTVKAERERLADI